MTPDQGAIDFFYAQLSARAINLTSRVATFDNQRVAEQFERMFPGWKVIDVSEIQNG